jgi:quinol monooxygenase YgiN
MSGKPTAHPPGNPAGELGGEAPTPGSAGARMNRVAVVVSLDVKPGREDDFLRLLNSVLDRMRHEPTFINAVLHRDRDDPGRFMVYETWADFDDLVDVQIHRDYRQAFVEALPNLLREPRSITLWQPLRSDFTFFGASAADPIPAMT